MEAGLSNSNTLETLDNEVDRLCSLYAQGLFKDKLPEKNELENQLLKDGIRHEELLISSLKKQSHLLDLSAM